MKYSDSVLIGMAIYSTDENGKDAYLERTLKSLEETVDFKKHKLYLSINAFTEDTKRILAVYSNIITGVIWNEDNLGTAKAINKVWEKRESNQHCLKMDDDVVINNSGWLEIMLDAVNRDNNIGIIGLKRKDCIETTNHKDEYYRSNLIQLPHKAGERWILVEECSHIMGTCQMYNADLLNKIGYLYQPKLYGWDDVLASARSKAEGFKNVFLPHIEIDHIDTGATPYQGWKESHAWEDVQLVKELMNKYKNKEISTYYESNY